MTITCNVRPASFLVSRGEIQAAIEKHTTLISEVQRGEDLYRTSLGWLDVGTQKIDELAHVAKHVNQIAEVMIVIGIGGSNRGAVAALEVLKRTTTSPTTLYFAGDTLSETRLADAMEVLKTKSVVLNVIAKDFTTDGPGITLLMMLSAMQA